MMLKDKKYYFIKDMFLTRRILRSFSMSTVPLADLSPFLAEKAKLPASFEKGDLSFQVGQSCDEIAKAFHEYGSLGIIDSRAKPEDNNRFLDLMEKYFQKRSEEFYANNIMSELTDCFPESGFEKGVTPEFIERARNHEQIMSELSPENRAETSIPIVPDAKWRYMYFIGEEVNKKLELSSSQYVPKDFPDFKQKFDNWGNSLVRAVETVSEMSSLGLGFRSDFLSNMLKGGQHLLSPTGSDLKKFKKNTIFASFHYDFNFLTIHGKSRYPGLFIWLRDGTKIPVVVPDNYLLLQSGRQFEILTGGYIKNGFHEVVYSEATEQKYLNELSVKGENQWRVSSTLFTHMAHNVLLEPQDKFRTPESVAKYLPITSYQLLEEELMAINLHPSMNN